MLRPGAIVVSVVVHAGIFATALGSSRSDPSPARKPTTMRIARAKPTPPPEPPKAPPPPAPKKLVSRLAPPSSAAAPKAAARPVQTALVMSNATLGSPGGSGPRIAGPSDDAAPSERTLGDSNGGCTEAPTKPEVTERTSDIEYTSEAREQGIEGRLVLKISVGADGEVVDVQVVAGVQDALDAQAIQTVKAWRFKPATQCGKALPSTYTLARRFELGD